MNIANKLSEIELGRSLRASLKWSNPGGRQKYIGKNGTELTRGVRRLVASALLAACPFVTTLAQTPPSAVEPSLGTRNAIYVPSTESTIAAAVAKFDNGTYNTTDDYIRVEEGGNEGGFTIDSGIGIESNPLIIYFEASDNGDFTGRYEITGQVEQYSPVWWYRAYFKRTASDETPNLALYPGADGTTITRSKFEAVRAIGTGENGIQSSGSEEPINRLTVMLCHFYTPSGTHTDKHIYVDLRSGSTSQASDYVFYRNHHEFRGNEVSETMGIYSNPGYASSQPYHDGWLVEECYFEGISHRSYYLKHSRNGYFIRNVHDLEHANGNPWGTFGIRGHIENAGNTFMGEKVVSLGTVIIQGYDNTMEDCDLGDAVLELSAGSQKNPPTGKKTWSASGARVHRVSVDKVRFGDLSGSGTSFFEKLDDVELHDCDVNSWVPWSGSNQSSVTFNGSNINLVGDLGTRLSSDIRRIDDVSVTDGADTDIVSDITTSDVGPGIVIATGEVVYDDVDGSEWTSAAHGGTASSTTSSANSGTHSLEVNTGSATWHGVKFNRDSPRSISGSEELSFYVKSSGGSLPLKVFIRETIAGSNSSNHTFTATGIWAEVSVPFSTFGSFSDLAQIIIANNSGTGNVDFFVDDVTVGDLSIGGGGSGGVNLLTNPDFSGDLSGWVWGGSYTPTYVSNKGGETAAFLSSSRSGEWENMRQNIGTLLNAEGDGNYKASARVWVDGSGTIDVNIELYDGSTNPPLFTTQTINRGSWQDIALSSALSITGTGSLGNWDRQIRVWIDENTSAIDYWIDEVHLEKQ